MMDMEFAKLVFSPIFLEVISFYNKYYILIIFLLTEMVRINYIYFDLFIL